MLKIQYTNNLGRFFLLKQVQWYVFVSPENIISSTFFHLIVHSFFNLLQFLKCSCYFFLILNQQQDFYKHSLLFMVQSIDL